MYKYPSLLGQCTKVAIFTLFTAGDYELFGYLIRCLIADTTCIVLNRQLNLGYFPCLLLRFVRKRSAKYVSNLVRIY